MTYNIGLLFFEYILLHIILYVTIKDSMLDLVNILPLIITKTITCGKNTINHSVNLLSHLYITQL